MRTMVCIIAVLCVASVCLGGATEREKMLLRYILQNDFMAENVRQFPNYRLQIPPNSSQNIWADCASTNPATRNAAVLMLGTNPNLFDPEKTKQVLKERLKDETASHDEIKLDVARVLAWFGDNSGKVILENALYGGDTTIQSVTKVRKAIIPLMVIDYHFQEGIPSCTFAWGSLGEYLHDEASKRKPNQASEAIAPQGGSQPQR